ncbi:M3 family metallopeptidase [Ideonella sp.]|uniref:M3 family metallopeptidase n=1 Tax=Ideonella sp. TaxID=1929293 RepID=UPI002B48EAA5|nr:M3 family metallopeptidase [Ideonella sp.]HJV72501.1 M3 family metallopeptidase [Ideonella sp.]
MSIAADPSTNPLLEPWTAPFGLPPFDRIRPEHFAPALAEAMRQHRAELDAIGMQPELPTFENTVEAVDRAGALLYRIESLLGNLTASETSPALQAVQRQMAAPLAAHDSAVKMHRSVFARLDLLHRDRAALGLPAEGLRLIERLHLDAVRAGARFTPDEQRRYSAIMQELAELTTRFAQNVLADESSYLLPLNDEADLAGLPAFVRAAASQAAAERGLPEGAHAITLNRSLIVPFLTFSQRRDLREKAWRAWVGRGETGGPTDNRALARQILRLRRQQAQAHGFASYADYALADTMAGHQGAVRDLLGEVWTRALPAAERERQALAETMRSHGVDEPLAAWDWRYWSEKVRQARYAIDEAELKPYFALDNMVQALFDCAGRLFGVRFEARPEIRAYHPDVKAYEMFDAEGRSAGLFLHDNFARQSKRSGAWMSDFNYQSRNRAVAAPIIVNNNNFAKAAPGQPTLLSFDDARTLFHEFGHGLHGLLSRVTYHRLAGTQVLRDFVELPSQLFEHWLGQPEVLARHARHWQTGESIPAALIERLQAAQRWGQGFDTVSYLGSALVDLALHARSEAEAPQDLSAFEREELARLGMPEAIGVRHRLAHFQHLFAGSSYACGYYVYLWAEVLDADAFNAFEEAGNPFDAQVAARLHRHIYAVGDTVSPQQAYTDFRGRLPAIEPLLSKRGLLEGTNLG